MFSKRKFSIISLALAMAIFAAGCRKKPAAPPPPPPPIKEPVVTPPPAAPTVAQFTAEPTSIQRGQTSTLRWEVTGTVTSVSINLGIGTVQSTGSNRVNPSESTTYTLTASGPGGNTTASATVNVTAPPPAVEKAPPAPPRVFGDVLNSEVQDAYFDYDKTELRSDARDVLTKDAAALKSIMAEFPNASIVIEGHCDERGSAEYNLGLGDRRANAAKEFLQGLGVAPDRIKTISYGKERPQCTEQDETCYQKNRRAHFAAGQ